MERATVLFIAISVSSLSVFAAEIPAQPNIILILADDMGYGDIASYGHPSQEYGPLDKMAKEGLRFTQAYSADSVCSPSRGSLLTGRLPVRTGMWGNDHRVFLPWVKNGLPRDEVTIAEALKESGYTTGFVGKWHLGINRNQSNDGYHLPYHHGFDFVGHMIPFGGSYSCDSSGDRGFPSPSKCAYYYNDTFVSQPYHQENLTIDFVNDIKEFIEDNRNQPFFFYYAMMHPHAPLFTSKQFSDSSRRGRYGDNINEMSWAVGEIMGAVKANNLQNNTLIVFMSDHGPHREYCADGGDSGIWRGFKSNSFEGGYRVPLITYWPGVITPAVSNELFSALDIYPIFIQLAGGDLPVDRVYDGVNSPEVLLGMKQGERDFILFYNRDVLFAVRYNNYKLHYHTQRDKSAYYFGTHQCYPTGLPPGHYFDCGVKEGDCVTDHDPPLIFDLSVDPTESWPLDPSEYDDLLRSVDELIAGHKSQLTVAAPLMDEEDFSIQPCCNVTTECICNFEL